MKNTCPVCFASSAEKQAKGIQVEHCSSCGTMWLDFSIYRPRLYHQIEQQVTRWETKASIAHPHCN